MTGPTVINSHQADARGPERTRLWAWSFVAVAVLTGWFYLLLVIADMLPIMDMGELGPGMGWLNNFNQFNGLSAEMRLALSIICSPNGLTSFGMPDGNGWGVRDLFYVFLMWEMMVFAMMLPTAIPMLIQHARHGSNQQTATVGSAIFGASLGYLCVWTVFSLCATAIQWGLTELSILSNMMAPVAQSLTISILVAVALYQLTPMKRACLNRCRNPRFLNADSRPQKKLSNFSFGIEEGISCLGCCWALMIAMFAVGIMNIFWIILLAAFMVVEKTSEGTWASRFVAIAMLGFAVILFLQNMRGVFLS
ncbi:MAG: DUF2182 domain-containing protein [Stappiaceae bacterium]